MPNPAEPDPSEKDPGALLARTLIRFGGLLLVIVGFSLSGRWPEVVSIQISGIILMLAGAGLTVFGPRLLLRSDKK